MSYFTPVCHTPKPKNYFTPSGTHNHQKHSKLVPHSSKLHRQHSSETKIIPITKKEMCTYGTELTDFRAISLATRVLPVPGGP